MAATSFDSTLSQIATLLTGSYSVEQVNTAA